MAVFFDGDCSYYSTGFSDQSQEKKSLLGEYGSPDHYIFRSLQSFEEVCLAFYAQVEKGNSPYLGFTDVKMSDLDGIDKARKNLPKMTIHYDWNEEILVIKFMVGIPHELCARTFAKVFEEVVRDQTRDRWSLMSLGSARFAGPLRMKEGDAAFKPNSRILETDFPTIVFEVGVSESLIQLQQDARFWIESSASQTRIGILLSVNCNRREIVIESWQAAIPGVVGARQQLIHNIQALNPYVRIPVAVQVQHLALQEGQNYNGSSLLIPANLAYDVVPPILGPNDFEISTALLNEFNKEFWAHIR